MVYWIFFNLLALTGALHLSTPAGRLAERDDSVVCKDTGIPWVSVQTANVLGNQFCETGDGPNPSQKTTVGNYTYDWSWSPNIPSTQLSPFFCSQLCNYAISQITSNCQSYQNNENGQS
jgi:hypothetical protein